MSQGIITFDSKALRLLSIKEYKIRTMHTTISVLRIKTTDKQWFYGKLEQTASKDSIYIVDNGKRTKLARTDISSVMALRKDFFDRLDGNVTAGLSFSKSSSIGQFNLSGTAKYSSRSLESTLTVNELGSIDSGKFSRDQESVQLGTYHYINNTPWVAGVALVYQRNIELALSHRYQGILAAGNKVVAEHNVELLIMSGISGSTEQSIGGVESGALVEIPLIVRLDYFKFRNPNMQISMVNSGFASLSQKGRYRYDGSIYFSFELVKDFYFTTNLYTNFDSKPPDAGSNKIDYGIVTGISYKF
jgi:hypothetical protein